MRYLTCFLIAMAFLLSPLRCQAQSGGAPKHEAQKTSTRDWLQAIFDGEVCAPKHKDQQTSRRAKKTSLQKVTVILTNDQKIDGEMLGWINSRFLIRRNGAVQSFAYLEIKDIKVKRSFLGKVRRAVKIGIEVAGVIVLIPATLVALPFVLPFRSDS